MSEGGLEPPRPYWALAPQASASANSATPTWTPYSGAEGRLSRQARGSLRDWRLSSFQGLRVKNSWSSTVPWSSADKTMGTWGTDTS